MRELLEEVLDLQRRWESTNTPEMKRRGLVIRDEMPAWLRARANALGSAAGIDDVAVEGKDAIGRKSRVPWVRIHSADLSPHPTEGWYVVYLFAADGHAVYLSLNQGATIPIASSYRPKPPDRLRASVAWARDQLGALIDPTTFDRTIDLRSSQSRHTVSYEQGNVVAIRYDRGRVPEDRILHDDALTMSRLLGEVYRARERSPDPGDVEPEVAMAVSMADDFAGNKPSRSRRQGFRLSYEERRAIELHGMRLATEYFEGLDWKVENVSTKKSFDLEIRNRSERRAVEVKATTSLGDQIILTRAEVREQRKQYPKNALVVVHSVTLERGPNGPIVSGGLVETTAPWLIDDDRLEPIAYTYKRR